MSWCHRLNIASVRETLSISQHDAHAFGTITLGFMLYTPDSNHIPPNSVMLHTFYIFYNQDTHHKGGPNMTRRYESRTDHTPLLAELS